MGAVEYAGLSDVGCRRTNNQDRWGVDAEQGLFMVADGVAGSTDGALAAQMVVELLPTYVARHLKPAELQDSSAAERLGRAVAELSDDLHAKGQTDARVAGATTTLVAALVAGSHALVAHLGDSRAYLYHAQQLHRLTRDHSLLQALIDSGELTVEQAEGHVAGSVITRHIAMPPPALPDAVALRVQDGDRILLCSDGLHGVVDHEPLTEILSANRDPADVCAALIAAAKDAGGPDNITAVVVDISVNDAEPQ
jgi:PPM family protein phosphatase